jgi:enterochelin esterase-like enzyme
MPVALHLEDPDEKFASVRLSSDLHLSDAERSFARNGDGWVLELELPDVQRLEYQLEVSGADGDTAWVLDPANPKRAPGAFGEKSVLELPGYEPPAWLSAETVDGGYDELAIRGRGIGAEVPVRVWGPAGTEEPLRLLLANDGPEYDELASLTRFCAAKIASGELPAFRVALLQPLDRDNWYSGSARYSRVVVNDIIPALRERFGVIGAPVGMGASLGALAMLHVQRRHPRALSGAFLQSGSFFMPRYDAHERRFSRYARVTRFVRDTRRSGEYAIPVPVGMTVGIAEENAQNNREMARALAEQGYDVFLEEVPDMHNYVAWRDAFDPSLTTLLRRAWTR